MGCEIAAGAYPQVATIILHEFNNHFPALLLINPENDEGYAGNINRLHENIEFRDQEIKRCSTHRTCFNAKKTASECLSVYEQIIK